MSGEKHIVSLYLRSYSPIMRKEKKYEFVKFSSGKLKEGVMTWLKILPRKGRLEVLARIIVFDNETWDYDSDEEFFDDFEEDHDMGHYRICYWGDKDAYFMLEVVSKKGESTTIQIAAPNRSDIQKVFNVFDKDVHEFKVVKKTDGELDKKPVIFIGHGKNCQWEQLKKHFDKNKDFRVESYETGARAGHAIRDILDEHTAKSSFAFLVLTQEDEQNGDPFHARPNIIHETGLFQGKLGYNRAFVLVEEGAGELADLCGIQQIKFPKDNIRKSFKDIQATIERELN